VTELALTRTPGDRRLYALEGIGTLRLEGLGGRRATIEAGTRAWSVGRRGFWRRAMQATDAAGTVIGEFEPRSLRRGGTVRWNGRELAVRPSSAWRQRYALLDGERELALLDAKGWGKRPVRLTVSDAAGVEPGLLLFAAFVARGLAEDAAAAAS
jgi:hypothetical protein